MRNPGISIPKPVGLRPETSRRIKRGPSAIHKKAPRKYARGLRYC